ncbi:MAG: ABC transporter ATP-binding protein, partial [Methylococcaceae bacterium]|nr:ABC transporter ATP-binding protein [Methylococcaceae bacterium]
MQTQANQHTQIKYTWQYITNIALKHKKELISAHIIAVLATIASVPVPLLMPLLVDEVLLNKPGITVNTINALVPNQWH